VGGGFGSEADARSVTQPQPGALGLPGGDLQPLVSPDPLDPLVVDQPTGPAQQFGDLAIAAVLPGQLDDVGSQPRFILTALRVLALPRVMLAERRTGRRSEIDSTSRMCSTPARRRAGLSSFPGLPPAGSACLASDPTPRDEAAYSPPPAPSGV